MPKNKFLNLKTYTDAETGRQYYYAERRGVDSVAFVLVDLDRPRPFGLINEFKPPISARLTTAFGGSIDTPGQDLKMLVAKEVLEESGYLVGRSKITSCGKFFVSTQMNQFCHLFMVDVTGLDRGKRITSDHWEQTSKVVWTDRAGLAKMQDWKAPMIVQAYDRLEA